MSDFKRVADWFPEYSTQSGQWHLSQWLLLQAHPSWCHVLQTGHISGGSHSVMVEMRMVVGVVPNLDLDLVMPLENIHPRAWLQLLLIRGQTRDRRGIAYIHLEIITRRPQKVSYLLVITEPKAKKNVLKSGAGIQLFLYVRYVFIRWAL